MREAVVLAAILSAPEIAAEFEPRLEAMRCADPSRGALRDAILGSIGAESAMRARAEEAIGRNTLESLLAARHLQVVPCLRRPGEPAAARLTVAEELAKLEAQRGWTVELEEAEEDMAELADEALTWRLAQAAEARNRAGRLEDEDDTDYEVGPNGALIDRQERSALDSLLSRIRFEKGR
jgi:DNA primase